MFKRSNTLRVLKKFKNRRRPPTKRIKMLSTKTTAVVFFRKTGLFGIKIYERLVQGFRRFVKKRKYGLKFFVGLNRTITLKSTNSRMGKGKGSHRGWVVRSRAGSIFLTTQGMGSARVFNFFKIENARLGNLFTVVSYKTHN